MHDDRIEDRLRSVLRREGDDLTLNITAQELERRLALRRRERAGRRLSLVAAGIAVVAIGGIVAGGNGWIGGGNQAVGGKPVSTTANLPTASASAEPTPPELASPSAIATAPGEGGLGCPAVDPAAADAPPELVAGVFPGDSLGYGGQVVASHWNGHSEGTPGSWVGLPPDAIAVPMGATNQVLQVVSDGCMVGVAAEALLTVYAETPTPSPTPIQLAIDMPAPSRVATITPPPTGGWTVRVRTTFRTTDGSQAWSESLFRVFVPFDPPELLGTDGHASTPWAEGKCANYALATGASASDQCGAPYEPIDPGAQPHPVPTGNTMVFELSGSWQIDQARVTAVAADLVAAGSFAPEYSVAFIDRSSPRITVPANLDPGTWTMRISLRGSRGGDTFDAYYDFPLTVTP